MKTSIAALSFLFSSFAFADTQPPVRILPICTAEGPVYLELKAPTLLEGWIGRDFVALSVYENGARIHGSFKGEEINLKAVGLRIDGHVGERGAHWRISAERDAAFGYQDCVLAE